MKYLSLFSGVGGFELGIQRAYDNERSHPRPQARPTEPDEDMRQVRQRKAVQELPRDAWRERAFDKQEAQLRTGDRTAPLSHPECVGFSEIDRYAVETYQKHFEHPALGDATGIISADLPHFDLLVGGFPCQAFSIAGKRLGFSETRGTLFFDIARLLADKRPRHLVLENVKGLLTHDNGKTFQTILGILTDLGYRSEWHVLNAKNHGVPQNRERIFIIGHLADRCARQVFPIGSNDQEDSVIDQPKALRQVGNIDTKGHNSLWGRVYDPDGVSSTLNAHGGGLGAKTGLYAVQPKVLASRQTYGDGERRSVEYHEADVAPTIRATHHKSGDNQPVVMGMVNDRGRTKLTDTSNTIDANYYKGIDNHQQRTGVIIKSASIRARRYRGEEPRIELRADDVANTITSVEKDSMASVNSRIRRLTPTECERLMSWPDGWTEGVSDTQRYKQCGNGVVSNVVRDVITALIPCLEEPTEVPV